MKISEHITEPFKIVEAAENELNDGVLMRTVHNICNLGRRNKNNRIYSRECWDRVLKDTEVTEKLENRSLFGLAEHPDDTQGNLEKVSHVITKIWIDEDANQVFQEMDILDTPYGRILETLLRAGCGVGVSTRADGELEESEDDDGKFMNVIPESYQYVSTDYTIDPSTLGAAPVSVKKNVFNTVKTAVEAHNIDQQFATCLMESIHTDEAKSLVEKINETTFDKEKAVVDFINSADDEDVADMYKKYINSDFDKDFDFDKTELENSARKSLVDLAKTEDDVCDEIYSTYIGSTEDLEYSDTGDSAPPGRAEQPIESQYEDDDKRVHDEMEAEGESEGIQTSIKDVEELLSKGKIDPIAVDQMKLSGAQILYDMDYDELLPEQQLELLKKIGGLAGVLDEKVVNEELTNLQKQLEIGIEVEMEHTDDTEEAAKIAVDHLQEDPEYYTKLAKMEAGECDESKKQIKEYIEGMPDEVRDGVDNVLQALEADEVEGGLGVASAIDTAYSVCGAEGQQWIEDHMKELEDFFKGEGLKEKKSAQKKIKLKNEKIVKIDGKWQVQSSEGKNLGTYDTKKDALKRLRQVEYFKSKNESVQLKEFNVAAMSKKEKDDFVRNTIKMLSNDQRKMLFMILTDSEDAEYDGDEGKLIQMALEDDDTAWVAVGYIYGVAKYIPQKRNSRTEVPNERIKEASYRAIVSEDGNVDSVISALKDAGAENVYGNRIQGQEEVSFELNKENFEDIDSVSSVLSGIKKSLSGKAKVVRESREDSASSDMTDAHDKEIAAEYKSRMSDGISQDVAIKSIANNLNLSVGDIRTSLKISGLIESKKSLPEKTSKTSSLLSEYKTIQLQEAKTKATLEKALELLEAEENKSKTLQMTASNRMTERKALFGTLEERSKQVAKLSEELETLAVKQEKKLKEIENRNSRSLQKIKEKHKKELISIYISNELKHRGLRLSRNSLALLRECTTTKEVDETLENLIDDMREQSLHSSVMSNILLEVPDVERVDPATRQVRDMITTLMDNM